MPGICGLFLCAPFATLGFDSFLSFFYIFLSFFLSLSVPFLEICSTDDRRCSSKTPLVSTRAGAKTSRRGHGIPAKMGWLPFFSCEPLVADSSKPTPQMPRPPTPPRRPRPTPRLPCGVPWPAGAVLRTTRRNSTHTQTSQLTARHPGNGGQAGGVQYPSGDTKAPNKFTFSAASLSRLACCGRRRG